MNNNIIGFAGKAGCGKGTAAEYIKRRNEHVLIASMASELKRIARDEFEWDGNKDEKGRRLLQFLGSECGRMYGGEDFWVNKWCASVAQWESKFNSAQSHIVVCDDIRYDNEAQRLRDLGGTIVLITDRAYDMGENNNHDSEKGISPHLIDVIIPNNKDIESFYSNIDLLMSSIILKRDD